uniref:Uncharacterized protein n=1 Tax=Timema bartmani TaxID=61472 RepID=A0A7R9HWD9_9NEOP|nr:unnamed protein product [Timema bartmani]
MKREPQYIRDWKKRWTLRDKALTTELPRDRPVLETVILSFPVLVSYLFKLVLPLEEVGEGGEGNGGDCVHYPLTRPGFYTAPNILRLTLPIFNVTASLDMIFRVNDCLRFNNQEGGLRWLFEYSVNHFHTADCLIKHGNHAKEDVCESESQETAMNTGKNKSLQHRTSFRRTIAPNTSMTEIWSEASRTIQYNSLLLLLTPPPTLKEAVNLRYVAVVAAARCVPLGGYWSSNYGNEEVRVERQWYGRTFVSLRHFHSRAAILLITEMTIKRRLGDSCQLIIVQQCCEMYDIFHNINVALKLRRTYKDLPWVEKLPFYVDTGIEPEISGFAFQIQKGEFPPASGERKQQSKITYDVATCPASATSGPRITRHASTNRFVHARVFSTTYRRQRTSDLGSSPSVRTQSIQCFFLTLDGAVTKIKTKKAVCGVGIHSHFQRFEWKLDNQFVYNLSERVLRFNPRHPSYFQRYRELQERNQNLCGFIYSSVSQMVVRSEEGYVPGESHPFALSSCYRLQHAGYLQATHCLLHYLVWSTLVKEMRSSSVMPKYNIQRHPDKGIEPGIFALVHQCFTTDYTWICPVIMVSRGTPYPKMGPIAPAVPEMCLGSMAWFVLTSIMYRQRSFRSDVLTPEKNWNGALSFSISMKTTMKDEVKFSREFAKDTIRKSVFMITEDVTIQQYGEMGVAVALPSYLPVDLKHLVDDGWRKNGFNQYASDLVSVHRKLPDFRESLVQTTR